MLLGNQDNNLLPAHTEKAAARYSGHDNSNTAGKKHN
jgi:hypothetical protein